MKKQIIERLLKAEQITFDEALELMDKVEQQVIYVQPFNTPNIVTPPWWVKPQITC